MTEERGIVIILLHPSVSRSHGFSAGRALKTKSRGLEVRAPRLQDLTGYSCKSSKSRRVNPGSPRFAKRFKSSVPSCTCSLLDGMWRKKTETFLIPLDHGRHSLSSAQLGSGRGERLDFSTDAVAILAHDGDVNLISPPVFTLSMNLPINIGEEIRSKKSALATSEEMWGQCSRWNLFVKRGKSVVGVWQLPGYTLSLDHC